MRAYTYGHASGTLQELAGIAHAEDKNDAVQEADDVGEDG